VSLSNGELLRLLKRARREEAGAIEALVKLVQPVAAAWARAACPNREEAEDVLQESLLELHRSVAGLREEGAFLPWLRRVVHNNAVDRGRRRTARREVSLAAAPERSAVENTGDAIEAGERHRQLLAALAELGPEDREMLTLRHEAGLTLADIAEVTGHSPRAVESRLFRARRALRARLGRGLRS
jgi:RNA polymerase sigma-70 factor (ECF subfamily)